jgi:ankyrin repeat protein
LEVVKYFVEECGANIHSVDNIGSTPLHSASMFGYADGVLDVVRYLVEHCGADVDAVNNNGNTPLHMACSRHCLDIVKYFTMAGANVHAMSNTGRTPLHYATECGLLEVAKYLVETGGANIHTLNKISILESCYNDGVWKVVQYLVEQCGANIRVAKGDADDDDLLKYL